MTHPVLAHNVHVFLDAGIGINLRDLLCHDLGHLALIEAKDYTATGCRESFGER